eukprot:TRINITY_DN69006_c0_g1_i1.p1 TRINITY_DN69006_c0_g1~~TRINITY_DN69006_c0_g1_i1.p1  ORF type:complete len:237 (-),score=45.28 TRINITY_DN69006_c0_g1_i1:30-740(-)
MGVFSILKSGYNYVFPPHDPALYNPELEDRIRHANSAVEKEYDAMVNAYTNMRSIMKATESNWSTYAKTLEGTCTEIRKELASLARSSSQCTEAQETLLPKLFKQRSKSLQKAPIEGCARDTPNELEAANCGCLAGSEAAGCQDTKVDSDHILQCSQVRRRILPGMRLADLYTNKGRCSVTDDADFNRAILADGAPSDFKIARASVPANVSASCVILVDDILAKKQTRATDGHFFL